MPFKWKEMFQRENDLTKAKVSAGIEAHADQHAVLQVTIRQLQDDHAALEKSCAVVLGQYAAAQDRVETDTRLEQQLDRAGRAAHQAGHTEQAAQIAEQLQACRTRLESEQRAFAHAQVAADKAKAAFAQNGRDLKAKMLEAKELDALIDEAAMQHNMNEALSAVDSMSARQTPSFDTVRDRVKGQLAQEEGSTQLHSMDADLTGDPAGALTMGATDDIMSQWDEPAQVSSPSPKKALASVAEKGSTESTTDKLYQ